jgi:hypothetical protein
VTAGFVDCQTGKFIVDPSAAKLGPGDHDLVHIPSAGWIETATVLGSCDQPAPTDDCGWSPSGQEFAYADDTCSPSPCAQGVWDAGRVHVVDATGDQTITPAGEMDLVLGWTDQGIVVARISASAGATASGDGSRVFLAGDFGASFPDYLLDPTTGEETYIATTNAFAADGDGLWESDGSASALLHYDLATGTETTWKVPSAATATRGALTPVGFAEAQGAPLVVTPDGRLLFPTGPGTAEVIGAADLGYGVTYGGTATADNPYDMVSVPGGGFLILELSSVTWPKLSTSTTLTIDTFYWNPSSGLQNLGASFSVAQAAIPPPSTGSSAAVATPSPSQEAPANQRMPVFAGQALIS